MSLLHRVGKVKGLVEGYWMPFFTIRSRRVLCRQICFIELDETARDPKFKRVSRNIQRQIRRVKRHAICIAPESCVQVLSDPDDDKLLDLARSADADYLITGDIEAFGEMDTFAGIHIVTPAEFVHILKLLNLL